jgi:signal transduction histidine kinase
LQRMNAHLHKVFVSVSKLSFWRTYWIALLLLYAIVMLVAGTLRYASDVGRPFDGIIAYSNPLVSYYGAADVTPLWWPRIRVDSLPLQGIQLYQINDIDYHYAPHTLSKALQAGQTTIELWYEYNGQQHWRDLSIQIFTWNKLVDVFLPDILPALGFWYLAFYIYRVAPRVPLNRLVAIWLCSAALNIGLNRIGIFHQERFSGKVFDLAFMCGFSVSVAIFVQFVFFFVPSTTTQRFFSKGIIIFFWVWALLGVLMRVRSSYVFWTEGFGANAGAVGGEDYYLTRYLPTFAICMIFPRLGWFLWVTRGARNAQDYYYRGLVKVAAIGMLVALPFVLMRNANNSFGARYDVFFNYVDLRFLYVMMPTAIVVLMIRSRVLRTRSLELIIVPLAGASGFVMSIINALAYNAVPRTVDFEFPSFVVFLLIFAVSLFWATQASLWGWLGKFLQPEQGRYATMSNFTEALLTNLPQTVVDGANRVVRIFVEQYDLEYAAFWLRQRADHRGIPIRRIALDGPLPQNYNPQQSIIHLTPEQSVIYEAKQQPAILLEPQSINSIPDVLLPLLPQAVQGSMLLLIDQNGLEGVLVLGERTSGQSFNQRDLDNFALLSRLVQIYLNLIQELETATKTRSRLHDDTQYSLDHISTIVQRLIEHGKLDEDARRICQIILLELDEESKKVREILNDTIKPLGTGDVSRLVNTLRERNSSMKIDDTNFHYDLAIPAETQTKIYSWVKSLLNNVHLHAQATVVQISLVQNRSKILLTVQDNGIGMQEERAQQRRSQGAGSGLNTLKEQVQNLGGTVEICTEEGAGTSVNILIPALTQ